ncbi:sugar transferase [Microbacterium rhizophilus]|uniref:sugar transferase n=1 Tax=Microbacterium rhizophilus TaxID=3138934 RepID=UPI0031E64C28
MTTELTHDSHAHATPHDDASSSPSGRIAGPLAALTPSERPASSGRAADWRNRYARGLRITDAATLIVVVFGTQYLWLGWHATLPGQVGFLPSSYTLLSTIILILWMLALALNDTRNDRVIGVGSIEYKRIFDASFQLFGAIAILAFLLQVSIARGFLLVSFPIGILALFLERWLWRRWLGKKRKNGEYAARVVLVGSERSVIHVARELRRSPGAGYHVVGACVPAGRMSTTVRGTDIPVVGNVNSVERAMAVAGADTVVVASTDELGPAKIKEISWALEAGRQHLVLAPSIADIAGPRIHTRPVSGLPLIHVETPRFSAGQRFVKRMLDLFASVALVVVFSPLLLGLAVIVKASSPGPILFRQTRVGLHGGEFKMLKFRSMVQDAEARLAALQQERDHGNEIMFKMRDDPRVTPVGKIMRRFSLDELPQLLNVIGGSMSLVGPRPPLPREVDQYADHVHRRFLVKPGITGLWQVSGRSALSWDDTVRLDLSYVENWSLLGDLVILLKTFRAALMPGDTVA